MAKVVFLAACMKNTELNSRKLKLKTREYMILLQIHNRELAGLPAMTREELLERVTYEERSVDGALAELKKRGLIERRIILEITEEGRKIAN